MGTLAKSVDPEDMPYTEQGYRLIFFHQEQAGPLKQNDRGPSPKLRGQGFGRKLH